MSRPRYTRLSHWLVALLVLAPILTFASPTAVAAATLPTGFVDDLIVGVATPTALAFTPDGRMLVTRQTGQLMVYLGSDLQATALNLATPNLVCTNSERGLLGVAVDPAFTTNRTIFLYYTVKKSESCFNRVSSFILPDNNTINLQSETVLLDNMPSPNGNHNGGDLNFGKDGFLYVTIGEGGVSSAARLLNVLAGKILRITRDGAIPSSNPFQGAGTARCNVNGQTTTGTTCQEIYATGLRNPFRFGFDPNAAETRFFINDVGQNTWEEIDQGQSGADYGWNVREGFCANGSTSDCGAPPAGMTNPLYAYGRDTGCRSVTGGAFVPNGTWAEQYDGAYIFGDFICDKLFVLRQGSGGSWNATTLASGLEHTAVHLRFGPYFDTQALYYTTYDNGGQVRRLVQRFTDIPSSDPAYDAVEQLRARGLVKGYTSSGCASGGLTDPCYGPNDTSLRAQMAAMLVRAMGWSGEEAENPFTDGGGLAPELWDAVAILAAHDVAFGYDPTHFGPNDNVTGAQLVSFLTRAMVEKGYWQPAAQDDPTIYPNVPASTGHRIDLVTYVQRVGALPDHPANADWATWNDPATRGWFARTLWQALELTLTAP